MNKYFKRTALIIALTMLNVTSHAAETENRALVVCYSRDGHTKMVAEKLAEKFNADIEILIDKKNRTGALGNMNAGNDALMHKTTTIEPLQHNPADYDIILIGTPAWFSNMTPAVRTFITQTDLTGKTVGYFATCHRVGADKAAAQMDELVSKGSSDPKTHLPLNHKDIESGLDEKLTEFYVNIRSSANSGPHPALNKGE
ncbi:MAG: flavodoxin [Candidatus Auribacterota bacterium]